MNSEEFGPFVTITQDEYDELLDRVFKLNCLENGGVDNWEWYGEAMKPYWDENEDCYE